MKGLGSISTIELLFLSMAVSLIFVASLDIDELNVLGNVFVGIGGILLIASSQGEYLKGLSQDELQKDMLEKQLKYLRDKNRMKK